MSFLYFFLIAAFCSTSHGTECSTLSYARLIPTYSDMRVFDIELQVYNNLSKSACHLECSKAQFCLSFHYGQSDNSCILFRRRLMDFLTSEVLDAEGYILFQVEKPLSVPGSDCDVDVDCASLADSHCHQGSCRCDIGFDNDGCVCRNLTECTVFGNDFVTYEERGTDEDYLEEIWENSPERCQQSCVNNSLCRSAEMDILAEFCYIMMTTWFEVPESKRINWTDHEVYQRGCIW